MSTIIVVIGDTHVSSIEELPQTMVDAIKDADWVIHTGDYTRKKLIEDLILIKGKKFKGVYGNTDPLDVQEAVPEKQIIEIHGIKIGITHPASGGSSSTTKSKVLKEFRNEKVDIIIFGHTHEALIENSNGFLLLNPGQGYIERYSYRSITSFLIIEIDQEIKTYVKKINSQTYIC
ncbi:MAG: metallophosphoesterase family protein [Promethearchaeota archaeon]